MIHGLVFSPGFSDSNLNLSLGSGAVLEEVLKEDGYGEVLDQIPAIIHGDFLGFLESFFAGSFRMRDRCGFDVIFLHGFKDFSLGFLGLLDWGFGCPLVGLVLMAVFLLKDGVDSNRFSF